MTSSIAKPILRAAARGKWITAGKELYKCGLPSRSTRPAIVVAGMKG